MSKWITKETARGFKLWHSTNERRLVTVAFGSPIKVVPVGKYREPVSIMRDYNSLAFVSMGPKQVELSLKGNAGTSNGVTIEGKISVQVVVNDDESCIKRMVADAEEEECLLGDSILTAVQEVIASQTWQLMMSVGEKFSQTATLKLADLLHKNNSCFTVKSLTIKEIRPQNKEFAESLEKAARAKEDEKLQRDIVNIKAERAVLERKAKEQETQSEIQVRKLLHKWELESGREKAKLLQESESFKISTQEKLAKLLKTKEGKIAALPQEMFRYLSKELDVKITDKEEKDRLLQMLFKGVQSRSLGQLDAMRAMVERHFGINITEGDSKEETQEPEQPPLSLKGKKETAEAFDQEEKETQPIIDQSKDSGQSPELSEEKTDLKEIA